jgi:hypothetical protein
MWTRRAAADTGPLGGLLPAKRVGAGLRTGGDADEAQFAPDGIQRFALAVDPRSEQTVQLGKGRSTVDNIDERDRPAATSQRVRAETETSKHPPSRARVTWLIDFQLDGTQDLESIDVVAYAKPLGDTGLVRYRARPAQDEEQALYQWMRLDPGAWPEYADGSRILIHNGDKV